jgi:cell division protein FtsW (lipid II flippase)
MNLSNAIEAGAMVLIGISLVWLSLASRKRGDKNWWAYLVSLPIILYVALAAVLGHPVSGARH